MNDKKKLRDIVDAIESIEAYSVSSYDEFLADDKTQDAILYNLIISRDALGVLPDSRPGSITAYPDRYPTQ